MQTTIGRIGLVVMVLVAALLAGCGGTIPESRYYLLDYVTEDAAAGAQPLELSLGVDLFAARPLFRDRRLAYRVSQYEVAYYPYRFWAADPGELVSAQLADQLRRRRVATVVVEQPFDVRPDWILSGRIQRFEEVDRGEHWFAVIEMTLRLEDVAARRVLNEQVLQREVATDQRTPEAVAAAMSVAVQEIGDAIEVLLRETAREAGLGDAS